MKPRHFDETTRGAFAFLWTKPDGGFQWQHFDGEPWLCWPLLPGSKFEIHRYPPLGERDLHRKFGALKTEAAIQRFAGRFGLLTIDLERDVGIAQTLGSPEWARRRLALQSNLLTADDGLDWVGESRNTWYWEIRHMGMLLEVWDLVKKKDTRKLGQWVKWRHSPTRVWFEPSHTNGVPKQEPLAVLADWQFGDPIGPAELYVCSKINQQLKHVFPAVLPYIDHEIHFFPRDLLTALYVLFAQEVSGRVRPAIECLGCGRYFSPKDGHQRYHEENCRKAHWYNTSRSPKSPKSKKGDRE
jgi:hypothetical protein